MPPIVEVRSLVKRFGSFTAVDDLSLVIPAGGIFALLGPNGAGKTTIIKILMGMLKPTVGDLLVGGISTLRSTVEVKRRVGYLPDEPVFYDYLRGREIIQFAGEMYGLSRKEIEERGMKLAERLHLADALEEFAENYSRGMKKKLGLICALLHQPELVVLDEPTNGLDPHGTLVLHEVMREIAQAGRTVLFSTHLLDQAERLCTGVAVVNHGRLAAQGTLAELRNQFGADANLEALFFRLTNRAESNAAERVEASAMVPTQGATT